MSGCLGTEDYGDNLFTFIECKQKTPVTCSVRIFERADFGQTSQIVNITDRNRNLEEEILKEDCSWNYSQISWWRLQKPEIPSHVSALQRKRNSSSYMEIAVRY